MAEPPDRSATSATDIVHLDMDAFFASVEILNRPELVGLPVVVGGLGDRGVVASASYAARVFGIRSAMPMVEARRRCPGATFLQGHHDAYSQVSERLLAILRAVTPLVEPVALDEAFLDVHGSHRHHGSSGQIAHALRATVRSELELDCSVGVGRTKLVAKLASEAAKPRVGAPGEQPTGVGVVVVGPVDEREFLRVHPVRALPGVGPKTEERLARLGVSTIEDLGALEEGHLVALFGDKHGHALFDLAAGRDHRVVVADRATRSIGHEETFARDVRDRRVLESRLRELAVSVIERSRTAGLRGRTVQVKVRHGDFRTQTRQLTAPSPLDSAARIAELGRALLDEIEVDEGVRLLGLSVSSFETGDDPVARQLDLFDDAPRDGRVREVEVAAEEIRRRYGVGAIRSLASFSRRAEERPRPVLDN